jgi:hypothetical protein
VVSDTTCLDLLRCCTSRNSAISPMKNKFQKVSRSGRFVTIIYREEVCIAGAETEAFQHIVPTRDISAFQKCGQHRTKADMVEKTQCRKASTFFYISEALHPCYGPFNPQSAMERPPETLQTVAFSQCTHIRPAHVPDF